MLYLLQRRARNQCLEGDHTSNGLRCELQQIRL